MTAAVTASSTERRRIRAARDLLDACGAVTASSIVARAGTVTASSIVAIDQRRAKLGVTHSRLCALARVTWSAWWELRRGHRVPASVTVKRLERALDELAGIVARAPTPHAIVSLFHAAFGLVAKAQALDDASLDQVLDFSSEKPRDPKWLAMAHARRLAIYVVAVELEIPNADLAGAIGCSRQNVKQARDKVEDWRSDAAVDTLIADVARGLGRR